MKLGQVVEICTVNAHNKCEWHKERGKNGHDFHHIIGAVVQVGVVDVQLIGNH